MNQDRIDWRREYDILLESCQQLAAELEATREAEGDLRREWWINHGCDYHALYGDDGEMTCGNIQAHGPLDFKRQSIDELRQAVRGARLAASRALAGGEPT